MTSLILGGISVMLGGGAYYMFRGVGFTRDDVTVQKIKSGTPPNRVIMEELKGFSKEHLKDHKKRVLKPSRKFILNELKGFNKELLKDHATRKLKPLDSPETVVQKAIKRMRVDIEF